MRKESLEFLKELIETPSPSGFEEKAQALVRRRLKKYCDKVETDVHGNVIGVKNPEGKLRVMLAGHVDEVGFMVNHITDDGYLCFLPIGGVDAGIVSAQRVMVHAEKGPVPGVIGKKAIHLLAREPDERRKTPKYEDLRIDIGAKDRKAAEKVVAIGDPITFAMGLNHLMGDLVVGRGFDDRVGSWLVTEVMRLVANKQADVAVYGVSTVQEEIGLRGAHSSAYTVNPHVGIAIDVDHATDSPGVDKKTEGDISLGKGPVLHRGPNINPVLGRRLVQTARKRKMSYQMKADPRSTGTDAMAIQLSRGGVATAVVSVATRYIHTPVEVISLGDLEQAAKLLAAFLSELPANAKFIP